MAEVRSRSRRTVDLYWARLILRQWFNVSSTEFDYSANSDDDLVSANQEFESGVTKDEYLNTNDEPKLKRRNFETLRVQYMETKAIRICAGTWNVGGRVPPPDFDIDGWLDTIEPADIYVLGLQEIVPLNAGNVLGIENDQPASEWEDLLWDALSRVRPRKLKIFSHSDPPSPSKFKQSEEVSYSVQDMFVETSHDACDAISSMDNKPNFVESTDRLIVSEVLGSTNDNASCLPIQEYLQRQFSSPNMSDRSLSMQINSDSQSKERFSYTERVGLSWPEPPLKLLHQYVAEKHGSCKSVNLSITNQRKASYVQIVSKQMVGLFLTIWVRKSLRKHISNLCVSTVGVGLMGYIGNKGSVSVSMSIYQTPFCFLCTHL